MTHAEADTGSGGRLFFAFLPDPATRAEAARLTRELVRNGRAVPPENLHVTLAFVGEVSASQTEQLLSIGERLWGEPFELRLQEVGHFGPRRLSWLAPARIPAELKALHRDLVRALAKARFRVDRRAFRPHITLARKSLPHPFHRVEPVIWPVGGFRLVRSTLMPEGARYETMREWPLARR